MADELQSGRCRICGCTEETPCAIEMGDEEETLGPCWWINAAKTLCSNPSCLAVVPLEQIERELKEEGGAASVAG